MVKLWMSPHDYELLFNKPVEFVKLYSENDLVETLNVMDAFNRRTPLSPKVGEMVFLCTCADAYQKYTCADTIVLSLLFNPNLKLVLNVQDNERAEQLHFLQIFLSRHFADFL